MIWIFALAAMLVALVFLGSRLRGRPHTVITFTSGGAELTRGTPSAALMNDFEGMHLPEEVAAGRLEVLGEGDTLELRTPGLPDDFAQRVRNVALLKKQQFRRS